MTRQTRDRNGLDDAESALHRHAVESFAARWIILTKPGFLVTTITRLVRLSRLHSDIPLSHYRCRKKPPLYTSKPEFLMIKIDGDGSGWNPTNLVQNTSFYYRIQRDEGQPPYSPKHTPQESPHVSILCFTTLVATNTDVYRHLIPTIPT